jgi:DNA (cytosine-5)-methyltransferase 1
VDVSPKYIDLFSGCGGLSLGLEEAGFELVLAVEKSAMAAETFYHNFVDRIPDDKFWKEYSSPETDILKQASEKLIVNELKAVLDSNELLEDLKSQNIDLIAGGPPCQGFSLAGRRNPDDERNQLPWQFISLVEKISPKMVLIENVSGIRQNFNKHSKLSPFDQLKKALEQTNQGYVVQSLLVNAMHFGAPQHRPRVMLVGLRSDIAANLGITATEEIWQSKFDDPNGSQQFHPSLAPFATHFGKDILTVSNAIYDLDEEGYKFDLSDSYYRSKKGAFAKRMRRNVDWMPRSIKRINRNGELSNHVKRKHSERIIQRFQVYHWLRDNDLPPKLLNIDKLGSQSDQAVEQILVEILKSGTFPAVASNGDLIAKSSRTLADKIVDLKTKKHSQRPLHWDKPSPTIVSLPEDFVHPSSPRTMTVREMARFQSFPDNFEFRSKETTGSLRRRFEVPQYTQVGNAVPPILGKAVGSTLMKVWRDDRFSFDQPLAATG